MRISDWSSDVCSSDLSQRRLGPQAIAQGRQPHARGSRCAGCAQGQQFVGRSRPLFPSRARAAPHLVELSLARLDQERSRPPPRSYETGSASCRQNVCPYVLIMMVDCTLKNKTNKIITN